MAQPTIAHKLHLQVGHRACILQAPDGYLTSLGDLPRRVRIDEHPRDQYDLVQLFASAQADLEMHLQTVLRALKPGGLLWIAYPLPGSSLQTDLGRFNGWDYLARKGWEGVSHTLLNESWGARRWIRFNSITPTVFS